MIRKTKGKDRDNYEDNTQRRVLYEYLRQKSWGFLLLPALLVLSIFFLIPISFIFKISFCKYVAPNVVNEFTLENYSRFFFSRFYLFKVLLTTFRLAALSTGIALLLGYPFAYFLSRMRKAQVRGLLLSCLVLVLWTNAVIRIYGWMIILLDHGILNKALMKIGLVENPIPLIYNETGVLIAFVQISLPYIVISLLGVFNYIDPSLEEAAQTLGANRFRTLLSITVPLSIPGILAGTLLIFALNVNALSIPLLMGGGRVRMMGVQVYKYSMETYNVPFASAMAVILLVFTLMTIAIYTNLLNRFYRGVQYGEE